MHFNVISSGSKGNATLVISNQTVILIDMGISFERLNEGLQECHLTFDDITGAIFTHDHGDHIKGIKFLSPSKMYALKGTLPSLSNVVNLFEPFKIGDFTITPIETSHDATNPCGYLLDDGKEKMLYVTDTGYFPQKNLPLVKNPTYLIIESNHDIKMLLKTKRTHELKCRIMSDVGHLCNEDSAIAATSIIGPDTKEIVLAHLSEEANTPETALAAYLKVFRYFGINPDKYRIVCANQHHSTLGGNLNED